MTLEGKTVAEIVCAYELLYKEKTSLLQALDVISSCHDKCELSKCKPECGPSTCEPKCPEPPKCEPKCPEPPKCEPKCPESPKCEPKCPESPKCKPKCPEPPKCECELCCFEKPECKPLCCDEVDVVAEMQREIVSLRCEQATYKHTVCCLTDRLDVQGKIISQLKQDLNKILGVIYRRKC